MTNYNSFLQFVQEYLPGGFVQIDRSDELVQRLEHQTEASGQMFFIADMIKLKILFASLRSRSMLGVDPEQLDPGIFFTATHPDDLARHNVARTKLFNLGQQMYIRQSGPEIISTHFRFRGPGGDFRNTLVQCFLFYCGDPFNTVFSLQVNTDIAWFRKIRHGYHFYTGNDLSNFRFPDEDLLMKGHIFSDREFEVIRLIAQGQNSEQIAEKLFISLHTVNTHRRNILKKTGRQNTTELILELKDRGLI